MRCRQRYLCSAGVSLPRPHEGGEGGRQRLGPLQVLGRLALGEPEGTVGEPRQVALAEVVVDGDVLGSCGAASNVEDDRRDGLAVPQPEHHGVAPHPVVHRAAASPGLDLDVDEDGLGPTVAPPDLRHDVEQPPLALVDVGEVLVPVEPDPLEIEARSFAGKHDPDEVAEEAVEQALEELIMHTIPFPWEGGAVTGPGRSGAFTLSRRTNGRAIWQESSGAFGVRGPEGAGRGSPRGWSGGDFGVVARRGAGGGPAWGPACASGWVRRGLGLRVRGASVPEVSVRSEAAPLPSPPGGTPSRSPPGLEPRALWPGCTPPVRPARLAMETFSG